MYSKINNPVLNKAVVRSSTDDASGIPLLIYLNISEKASLGSIQNLKATEVLCANMLYVVE